MEVIDEIIDYNGYTAYIRKFPSGIMEQCFIIPITTNVITPWKNIYIAGPITDKKFPKAFIDTPITLLSIIGVNTDAAWTMQIGYTDFDTVPGFFICRGDILDTSIEFKVQVYAIGRWK